MTATPLSAKACAAALPLGTIDDSVPLYLASHYWWAYVHPKAVKLFERQWLVNLILWGNYARLRDAALTELGCCLPGRTLQVACVYGDLTNRLGRRAASGGGAVDVIDVLPIQLKKTCGRSLQQTRRSDCWRWIPPISNFRADDERGASRRQSGVAARAEGKKSVLDHSWPPEV